jgi:pyruvate,water dikinase
VEGDVLVTDMTDPDWEPIMKRASAIVTNRGGRTCHAAIIARELGVPAVVGLQRCHRRIHDGDEVTVSCAEGDTGFIYAGRLPFEHKTAELSRCPRCRVKVMMIVGNPGRAFAFSRLPNDGIGLARLEFIINDTSASTRRRCWTSTPCPRTCKAQIAPRIAGLSEPAGVLRRASPRASAPSPRPSIRPVIVRMSDFKSNEYANLLGGQATSRRRTTR